MPDLPDPPSTNPLTHFVLENPWPLVIILGGAALIFAWLGSRDGLTSRFKAAAALALMAVLVLAASTVITTAGEHGERIVQQFVEHAVAGDQTAAMALLTPDATFAFGSPTNPGYDLDFINRALDQVDRREVRSNRITSLRGYDISSDAAEVRLACVTEVEGGYGATPTSWILRVERAPAGPWKVSRIAFISVAGQAPQSGWLR